MLGIVVYFIMLCRCRKTKEERALLGILISLSAITLFLSIYQSYYRDYQPQGRYIITAILPFAYMLAYGVDKMKNLVADEKTSGSAGLIGRKRINATINSAILFSTIWLLLFFTVLGETLSKMFTYL